MTEQETKEKIINILNATEISVELSKEDIHTFADALIRAGVEDVSECKKESFVYWCEIAFLEEKINELARRAEVAERALDLCETAYLLSLNGMRNEGISIQAIASDLGIHRFFMERAEEKLAEERKNVD